MKKIADEKKTDTSTQNIVNVSISIEDLTELEKLMSVTYIVRDRKILAVRDAKTGKVIWGLQNLISWENHAFRDMAMSNITKFYPMNAAENPDNVLEQAIGQYNQVLIIGWNKDNIHESRGTLGMEVGDILELIEVFKFKLLNGDYGE